MAVVMNLYPKLAAVGIIGLVARKRFGPGAGYNLHIYGRRPQNLESQNCIGREPGAIYHCWRWLWNLSDDQLFPYAIDLYRVISVSCGDMSGPQDPGGVGEAWFGGHFIPDSGKRVAQSIQNLRIAPYYINYCSCNTYFSITYRCF